MPFIRQRIAALVYGLALVSCLSWNYNSILDHSRKRDQRYIYGWDDNHYFAWSRSWTLDRDADFANDFLYISRMRGMDGTKDVFAQYLLTFPPTKTGRIPNKFGVGMAVLSAPLMETAHGCARIYETITGVRVSAFASIYLLAFLFTSIGVGFLGIAVAYACLRNIYGTAPAFGAVVAGVLGLPLFFYIWFTPSMSHAAGFGLSTILFVGTFYALEALRNRGETDSNFNQWKLIARVFGLGVVFGVLVSVRYADALIGLGLLSLIFVSLRAPKVSPQSNIRLFALLVVAALGGVILGFLPQMLAWKSVYGDWITYSYQGEAFSPYPNHTLDVLFGSRNSLILWSPIAIFGVIGLVIGAMRKMALCTAGLIVVVAFSLLYGSWGSFSLGASFGMRGFVDIAFLFFAGLAEWIRMIRPGTSMGMQRKLKQSAMGLTVATVLWSLWLLAATRANVQPMEQPFQGWKLVTSHRDVLKQIEDDVDYLVDFGHRKYPLMTPYGSVEDGL